MWIQREIILPSKSRGFHLITNEIIENIPEIKTIEIGILHVFIKHTSASLTINENADHSVRTDFESHFNYLVPENQPYYIHTMEGSDDMPAHLKSSILGSSVSIPIADKKLNFGRWQGIYFCEHRISSSRRKLIVTVHGQEIATY